MSTFDPGKPSLLDRLCAAYARWQMRRKARRWERRHPEAGR